MAESVERTATQSPFLKKQPTHLTFGTMLIMLLMVVGAGISLLLYYALQVPAITQELNAWLGRPEVTFDRAASRRAQVTFALFVYTAPLALGIFVYFLHFLVNTIGRLRTTANSKDEDKFRME